MAASVVRNRFPAGPSEVVASYGTYAEAQRAIDFVAERDFPVERLAIVAGDLRFVEQVTGRAGYGRRAMDGAASGAVTGAFLGFILGLFSLVTPLTSGLILGFWGLLIGAAIGAVVGLMVHAFSGGRRDFSSVAGLQAGRYDVVAGSDVADRARRVLSELPTPRVA
jgi:uncharacterized protein YqgC (DUF456 family)